jgi:hypothetical protein
MGKYIKIAEDELIEMYLSNAYKVDEICKYFNVSKFKIRSILINNNILSKSSKKYSYNDNEFESIDSEEKAYWLGFLYADGYVRSDKRGNELKLKLGVKDKEHLLKFKKIISNDDIPVVYEEYKNSKCYKVSINSKKIVSDLIKLGCTNKKSLTIEFPVIKNELKNHFIRGYFDGDGSISYSNKQIVLNFVSGSSKFLLEISSIFNSIGCKKANLVGNNENYKYIQYNTLNDLTLLFRYLYSSNSNIFLNRKKEKLIYIIDNFKELKDIINKQRRDKYDRDKQNI